MVARTFREKNQQQSRVSFDVIFYVYTHVDNRERIRESVQNKGDEFRWKKRMKLSWRRCREKMRNVSGQQGEKKRGSGKTKPNMNTGNKIFGKRMRQFLHKNNV